MFYRIQDGRLVESKKDHWLTMQNGVGIVTPEEWRSETEIREKYQLTRNQDNIRFCKLECFSEYAFGTIHIPSKKAGKSSTSFAFYLVDRKIIFVDRTGYVKKLLRKMNERGLRPKDTIERFLYDFLVAITEDDLIYLESLETKIAKEEEKVLANQADEFNQTMLELKKEILKLYRYYSQLMDVGEGLAEDISDLMEETHVELFRIFSQRVERLKTETQMLREYAMQVQDVYQSEIGIRQNDVMKILTIVTTIFLPLTLIVGWYGMNFSHMPELGYRYSYPIVIIVSVLIVVVSIWGLKKKKYL
ncbi:magnesium and cobalt transport protein CorA [Lachnospiraceae bacterium KM106-2]|nr:magnesium and cobalt transport protein CorA [Lachnospiraceae bacterium KM106-2]